MTETLVLVHELDRGQLDASMERLAQLGDFSNLIAYDLEQVQTEQFPEGAKTLIMHLSLDNEIDTHRELSLSLLKQSVSQLNPYNNIAKIFDDKYLFYALMVANAMAQPGTCLIERKADTSKELKRIFKRPSKFVVKPRYGTEGHDVLTTNDFQQALQHLDKIHAYDDALVQGFVEYDTEFKVLYLDGKFHAQKELSSSLQLLLDEFLAILDDYAKRNHLQMPEIFSLDILETGSSYLILEANIRPAAIHSF
ncbi:MAG: hypothetical protein OXU45_04695 [Candidatus Melainabacteria bacterium]|nr:hypothetical protein [Candidatus Melainabacteria bacterium]